MRLGTYPSRTCENYYPVLFNFILNKKLSRFPSSAWKSPELMLLWKRPVMQIPGIKGCGRPLWRNGGSREQSSVGTGFKAIFSNSRSLTYRSSPEVRHSSQLGGAYFAGWVSPVGGGFPLFAPGFLRTGAPHGIQPCPHFLARRVFASRCLTQREFRSWSIERSEAKDIPQHHDIGLLAEQVPRNLAGECLAGFWDCLTRFAHPCRFVACLASDNFWKVCSHPSDVCSPKAPRPGAHWYVPPQ